MILKVQLDLKKFLFVQVSIALIFLTVGLAVNAQQEPVIPNESDWERKFIQTNKAISTWFDGVIEGIDLFLVGQKITNERNKSSFRIDNTTTVTEGENYYNVTSLTVRPRLQNLEEFMQLKFTTYDEKEDGRGVENGYLRKKQRHENYGATVGLFRKLGDVRTTFQPRIELQNPLKVSHSLGFESVAEIKLLKINPKLEFFADADKGAGTFHAINLNYELNLAWSFTFINEAEYQDKIHKFFVTNGFVFGQRYSDKTGFTYSWIINSHNREVYHLEEHVVAATWNQNIYRNILDFQLQPFLNFSKTNYFKGKTGVIFNLSLNF